MNEYHFNVDAAQRYGVDEAIFLHSLSFWLEKNRANRKHFHEGRYWTYNTQDAFVEMFPFWSRRQIGRIIGSCETQGAILSGNFNEDKSDRTKWYSMTDDAERFYVTKTVQCIAPNGEMVAPQGLKENASTKAPSIVPNGTTEPYDALHQTVKCNKETDGYTDSNTPLPPNEEHGWKKGLPQEVKNILNTYVGKDKELAAAMLAFMAVRSELGAKQTVRAVNGFLGELDELSGGVREMKIAILRQSEKRMWKFVFPLKDELSTAPAGGQAPAAPPRASHIEVRDGEEVVVFD
ncbi:MAG TPA: hypothetical protein VN421_09610 [Pseudoflavonifractor sp.]|nr:hypothetical protein [Pseudoflavonifractor sp.]